MPDYRVYIIGHDGHFQKSVPLECADDDAAKCGARGFVPMVASRLSHRWMSALRAPSLCLLVPEMRSDKRMGYPSS